MDAARELADKICADLDESTTVDQTETDRVIERHAPEPPLASPHPFRGWIDSVDVQGIRAFGTIQTIGLSRGLTVLYAENGSGKTSFIDAMELLSDGVTTRATQFPGVVSEVKDDKHVPHATIDGKPVGPPPQVVAHWYPALGQPLRHATWTGIWGTPAQDPPPVQLLARRRLREIINAKGVDRADRLIHSLGLGSLAATWVAAEKYLSEAATTLTTSEAIDPQLASAVENCLLVADIAQANTQADLIEAIKRWARGVLDRPGGSRSASDPAHAPADNLDIVVTPPPTPPASDRLQRLADELRDQEETSHTDTGADQPLADLLAAFRTVAVADSLCPGCESGQVTASRLASIDEVLAATESHRRRQQQEQALRTGLDTELRRINSADLSWTPPDEYKNSRPSATADSYNATVREANDLTAEWNAAIDVLRARLRDVETPPAADVVQSVATSLRSLHDLHNRIRDVAERAEGLRRALQAELTAEAPDAEWVQATYHLTHAEQLAATIHDRRRNAERATAYRGAAHTLKKRLQCVIDKRFQDLATPINDWLTRLAPDHTPQIQVTTKGTPGRAALQIHVEGGKVAAIGRLSDSQLDMLGLAAHLATLEREAPGHPVFIDDPTDMLDHPTREKLASEAISRLLGHHNDIPGRQVVVLTHDHHLVRLLWHHHGHNTPRTLQAVIETDRAGEVCEAVITPRSPDQYLTRVDTLLQNHPDETNRIWLRNAVGNLTRQALELIVKDVLVVVGKHGHNYLNDNDPAATHDTLGVGKAFERLEKVLEQVAERQRECGSPRHRSALLLIDKLTDATARRKDFLLDEASHPNAVYPSTSNIKTYAKSLRELVESLKSPSLRDEWPTTCRWHKELTLCGTCRPYPQ